MNPDEFASRLIDACAEYEVVKDYDLEIRENVVVRCRIFLTMGFIEVYRNFATEKIAFAWLVDGERVYGADNTGGWHIHPHEDPTDHRDSEPVVLEEFLENVREIISKQRE